MAYEREDYLKQVIFDLQAAHVLNGLFIDRVQDRLEGQEEKEARPSKKRKLLGNGLPKLLTDDKVFTAVAEHEAEQEREKELQAKRKEDSKRYEEALAAWKIFEREHDKEKAEAKQQGWKAGMAKPVLGPIEPKPGGKPVHPSRQKKATQVMDEDESEGPGEEMDEETSGSDSN
ncbi:hypothetical protein V8D89_007432 [Ganoderma adspersum]